MAQSLLISANFIRKNMKLSEDSGHADATH